MWQGVNKIIQIAQKGVAITCCLGVPPPSGKLFLLLLWFPQVDFSCRLLSFVPISTSTPQSNRELVAHRDLIPLWKMFLSSFWACIYLSINLHKSRTELFTGDDLSAQITKKFCHTANDTLGLLSARERRVSFRFLSSRKRGASTEEEKEGEKAEAMNVGTCTTATCAKGHSECGAL